MHSILQNIYGLFDHVLHITYHYLGSGIAFAPSEGSKLTLQDLSFTLCNEYCVRSNGAELYINRCNFYDAYCSSNGYYMSSPKAMVTELGTTVNATNKWTILNSKFYNTVVDNQCRAIVINTCGSFTMSSTTFDRINNTQYYYTYYSSPGVHAPIDIHSYGNIVLDDITLTDTHHWIPQGSPMAMHLSSTCRW